MWRVETTVCIQGSIRKTSAGWSTPEECWPHSGSLLCWVAAERQSRLNRFSWQRHKVHNNKGHLPTGGAHPLCFSFSFLCETSVRERSSEGCFVFAAFSKKELVCLRPDEPADAWLRPARVPLTRAGSCGLAASFLVVKTNKMAIERLKFLFNFPL